MKKSLLLSGLLAVGVTLNAQQRLVLYEEFTGENCPPCASTNPPLDALMESGNNPTKILKIQYQSPIPSAGPIYNAFTTVTDNRLAYYGVNFAPWGEMDGAIPPGMSGQQSPNHPGYVVQDPSTITTAGAVATPFTITISSYSISGGNISATIGIESSQTVSNTNLKLRAALVETLNYTTPPGTNGETHFPNVVRQMYPSADGQTIASSWSSGQSNSYTISGAVPSYVDLDNEHFLVVWIQDDGDKSVKQAARTYPDVDVISQDIAASGLDGLHCGLPFTVNSPSVTIRNGGNQTLTSATIYYKEANASTWQSQTWTGSLELNQTADVTLPNIDVTTAGITGIIDSVAMPNGTTDEVKGNNTSAISFSVLADANGQAMPVSNDFESSNPEWVPYAGANGYPLNRYTGSGIGYNGSNGFLHYPCYQLADGTAGYNILPFTSVPSGPKAIDFYVAYAQYLNPQTNNPEGNDKLEIVYSNDCGQSWTSVWNKSGADLATVDATSQNFIPSNDDQWQLYSVDVSSIPDGAQIAIRATSGYGNNIFVDNVNLHTGLGIDDLVSNNSLQLFPNPVNDKLSVKLDLKESATITFTIFNILGQQQLNSVEKELTKGDNMISINTNALASGVYFLNISSDAGTLQQKFVKK